MSCHGSRYRNAKAVLLFIVQERETIEPDHSICNATVPEAVTHSFGYSNHNLQYVRDACYRSERITLTIVGKMYVKAPVSSNRMTTTDTVICIIPLNAAPAPRKAYVPGVMQGTSGSHAEKKAELGYLCCRAWTRIPTIRPKEAPIAMEGTNIPAGTLQP